MINQAITDLNELSALLDEVSTMVDDLSPATMPIEILVNDVQIDFNLTPTIEHDVVLPRRAKIFSMFQNLYSPKKFYNFKLCTSEGNLTAKINIQP